MLERGEEVGGRRAMRTVSVEDVERVDRHGEGAGYRGEGQGSSTGDVVVGRSAALEALVVLCEALEAVGRVDHQRCFPANPTAA